MTENRLIFMFHYAHFYISNVISNNYFVLNNVKIIQLHYILESFRFLISSPQFFSSSYIVHIYIYIYERLTYLPLVANVIFFVMIRCRSELNKNPKKIIL